MKSIYYKVTVTVTSKSGGMLQPVTTNGVIHTNMGKEHAEALAIAKVKAANEIAYKGLEFGYTAVAAASNMSFFDAYEGKVTEIGTSAAKATEK